MMTKTTMMKSLARSLGKALKAKGHVVPHSVLLHVLAASGGDTNWHALVAKNADSAARSSATLDTQSAFNNQVSEALRNAHTQISDEQAGYPERERHELPQATLERLNAVIAKLDSGARTLPPTPALENIREALWSCTDMLQECLVAADRDSAETIRTVLGVAWKTLEESEDAPALVTAAKLVISRWEKGDLAEAVRQLDAALRGQSYARQSTLSFRERDLVINAVDQFISNAEEEGETQELARARELLERLQVSKLDQLGVGVEQPGQLIQPGPGFGPEDAPDASLPFHGCRLPKKILAVDVMAPKGDTGSAVTPMLVAPALWPTRCRAAHTSDSILEWLETGMSDDKFDQGDEVLEYYYGDETRSVSVGDLLEAILTPNGVFTLKDGTALWLIDETERRWTPRRRVR